MIRTYLFLASADGADPFAMRGDAAAECLVGLCPTAAGYVQSRALDTQLDAVPTPPYCGIAELWFTEGTDALAVAGRVETLSRLWRDAGVGVAAVATGMERIVMRRPEHHLSPAIKGVFPFRRKAGLGVAEFQRTWWLGHGPIAAQTEGALAYVQCHPLPACYRDSEPSYDGITELHWRDVASASAAMTSRQMREDQAGDAERFVDPDSVRLLLVEEEAVLPP